MMSRIGIVDTVSRTRYVTYALRHATEVVESKHQLIMDPKLKSQADISDVARDCGHILVSIKTPLRGTHGQERAVFSTLWVETTPSSP